MNTIIPKAPLPALLIAGLLFAADRSDAATPFVDSGPSAHQPQFENGVVWGDLDGKESFTKEQWPETRLLVWAHYDKGEAKGSVHDDRDAANWINARTGEPAESPPDVDTDVLLPDAGEAYMVMPNKKRHGFRCRHLTIGRNASLGSAGLSVSGNIWIRPGGRISNHGTLTADGDKHTFLRAEAEPGKEITSKPPRFDFDHWRQYVDGLKMISQYFTLSKEGDASVEIRGKVNTLDEFKVLKGTLIIGPGSIACTGRNATPLVGEEGTIAILSGAHFHKWVNQFGGMGDMILKGTIQGGMPERPLTADATFGLSFKNWNRTVFPHGSPGGQGDEDKHHRVFNSRFFGMQVEEGARLLTFSSDLNKHRLVVNWHGIGISSYMQDWKTGAFPTPEKESFFKSVPPMIDLVFTGNATVTGVVFENVHRHGLMLRDPSHLDDWEDVVFATSNGAAPAELIATWTGNVREGKEWRSTIETQSVKHRFAAAELQSWKQIPTLNP